MMKRSSLPSMRTYGAAILSLAALFASRHSARGAEGEFTPAAKKEERLTIYSPVGKRDPFRPPPTAGASRDLDGIRPIERYDVEQLQLKAVLRGMGRAKAMFEDPGGSTHILHEGDTIGREHATISRIVNSEVIITQKTFNYLGSETLLEKVISLPKEPEFDAVVPQEKKRVAAPAISVPARGLVVGSPSANPASISPPSPSMGMTVPPMVGK